MYVQRYSETGCILFQILKAVKYMYCFFPISNYLGDSPKALISSYMAFVGRMKPLPQWVSNGAVLGLQGGTAAVLKTIQQVNENWGNLSDVAAVWLQDWTGQRQFKGKNDLPRVGLWWNWEVSLIHSWIVCNS